MYWLKLPDLSGSGWDFYGSDNQSHYSRKLQSNMLKGMVAVSTSGDTSVKDNLIPGLPGRGMKNEALL